MSLSCCVSVKFRRNVEDYRGIPEEVTVAIPVGLLQKMIMFIYMFLIYGFTDFKYIFSPLL